MPILSDFGPAANKLTEVFAAAANLVIEPATIRRIARAKAEGTQIATDAEILRDEKLAVAKYRRETMDLYQEHNLCEIAHKVLQVQSSPQKTLNDPEWLANYIDACKNTSDSTLQELWAKLLAGELDAPGSCSKRTLQMAQGLSRTEALLIKDACSRVCLLATAEGDQIAFLNVIISRIESLVIGATVSDTKKHTLFQDSAPDFRKRNNHLTDCGFLSMEDWTFTFDGHGHLTPGEGPYTLTPSSPKKITLGETQIVPTDLQPGLLLEMRGGRRLPAPGATIEFDAWRLTPEGTQLFQLLNEPFDQVTAPQIGSALIAGGLSITTHP